MSCGCSKRNFATHNGETLGFIVILPDGTQVPPEGDPPFLSQVEARTEVRQAGGGTVKRLTRKQS
jgi:hypothetical protein